MNQFLILIILLVSPLQGARITGKYTPSDSPQKAFRDPYAARPVESYANPITPKTRSSNKLVPPCLYDKNGVYRGRLTDDPFHPESIGNRSSKYSVVYLNPHESLYIVEEELATQPYYPGYIPSKEFILEIDSGPFWNH